MARPRIKGLSYFPLNVDFFEDDKMQLIEAEFGINGVLIAVKLLCKIYKENGYYYQWGDDQCLLFAKKAGGGIVSNMVSEVINGLVKRNFFDKVIFETFNILTSKGIQERYIKALERSTNIEIIEDYLCKNTKTEVNVTLIKVNVTKTKENVTLSAQIKEDEIKQNEIKQNETKQNETKQNEIKQNEIKQNEINIISPIGEAHQINSLENDNIPTLEVFLNYAISKIEDINQMAVRLKYEAWKENNWSDGNDKKIKNWKTKLLNTLSFLPKNEVKKRELKQNDW